MSATEILLDISRRQPRTIQLFSGAGEPYVMLVNGKEREVAGGFPQPELVAFMDGLKQIGYAETSHEINGPG